MADVWNVALAMQNLTSAYAPEYEENFVDPVTTPHPTNNAKLMQVLYDMFWAEMNEAMEDLVIQNHPRTATGGSLDNFGEFLRVFRSSGEDDNSYRVRIAVQFAKLLARTQPDAIISFVAEMIGAEPSDITIIENTGTDGKYDDATFSIAFDFDLLAGLGFSSSEYADVIALVQNALNFLAAAGVVGNVLIGGGAEWDTDNWDDPDALYGN